MGLSNGLSVEAGSLSCCRLNTPWVFSIRGLRLYFTVLEPWVTWSASLPTVRPGLSVRKCRATGFASGQTACPVHPTLRESHSHHGNACPLRPSYQSGCMFLFYLLGVGLPCHSIFCQFWLFFVFKLLLSFFWLCEEAQCVFLCLHLGQKPLNFPF